MTMLMTVLAMMLRLLMSVFRKTWEQQPSEGDSISTKLTYDTAPESKTTLIALLVSACVVRGFGSNQKRRAPAPRAFAKDVCDGRGSVNHKRKPRSWKARVLSDVELRGLLAS